MEITDIRLALTCRIDGVKYSTGTYFGTGLLGDDFDTIYKREANKMLESLTETIRRTRLNNVEEQEE